MIFVHSVEFRSYIGNNLYMLGVDKNDKQKNDKQDGLTGLLDKDGFFERGQNAVQNISEQSAMLAVHLLYIRNLKDVIMEQGLHVGEGLLKSVANRLYGVLNSDRVFARIEGETFGLLQQDVDHDGHVLYVARRVLETLKDPVDVLGQKMDVEMSMGIAFYPEHGRDWEGIYHNAALALEKARHKEACQFVVFEE